MCIVCNSKNIPCVFGINMFLNCVNAFFNYDNSYIQKMFYLTSFNREEYIF